jgi:O-acetyl-ADP-ribose deacetylase (regulator of RNase III)
VITSSGNLPARFVIHTVGPIYGDDPARESELLAAAYRNSLTLAVQHALTSVAFPSISTGIYGYPKHEAAAISSRAIKEFLNVDQSVQQVRLVFFHDADARVFLEHHELE